MTKNRKITDYFKKVEMGDLKILVIGLFLLIVPIIGLFLMIGTDDNANYSKEHLQNMASRRSVFSFASHSSKRAVSGKHSTRRSWFSDASPEKKVELELEEAMKAIKRSEVARTRSLGMGGNKQKAYAAEIDASICNAKGALDEGKLAEAEHYYEEAFNRGDKNIFLKLQAISGLCEVYSRMEDRAKFEKAFQIYMDMVAQLPPGFGGGDLRASVRNAYLMLKKLKSKASPGKVTNAVLKSKLASKARIDSIAMKDGLEKALKFFPAKFQ